MGKGCCACKAVSTGVFKANGVRFYRFPVDVKKREAWVRAVSDAKGTKLWSLKSHHSLCSLHFISGEHSADPRHPDFAPTIFFKDAKEVLRRGKERKNRANAREKKKDEDASRRRYIDDIKRLSLKLHSYNKSPLEEPETEPETVKPAEHLEDVCTTGPAGDVPIIEIDSNEKDNKLIQDLTKENKELKLHVKSLEKENAELKAILRNERWGVHKIKDDDSKTKFYTGLPSFAVFLWIYNYLLPKAERMVYWTGNGSAAETVSDRSRQSTGKLSLIDQLFVFFMRIRLGLFVTDIAERFNVSTSLLTKYFTSWLCLLHCELKVLNAFPSRDAIRLNFPESFHKFPDLRIILDCTEIFLQKSNSILNQNLTFSNYKHNNTLKFLIGITPSGIISFVSEAWGGRVSDRYLTEKSGLLDLLEEGDMVMADKGFTIEDLLKKKGCTLNIPPFRRGNRQFTPEEITKTKKIAELRIHVERAIGRVKNYHILEGVVPLSLAPVISKVFQVCCWLCNFDVPLVS